MRGKRDHDIKPSFGARFCGHICSVRIHDGGDNRQTKSVSAIVPDPLISELLEWLEEAIDFVRGDCRSGITD